ncbi:MFS general substrate transporter [Aspergillus steynii IBT 23096]|uniref:MFS general substrate transporter n=1 Tax=Aspergillus steynii IBT 23096 TaxID=1392250 RepID=A0A2I2G3Y6_9EURO|nr:MFS general substrate transporter [Aspergillus steynii IBT 23096]PLB47573.1 MFS general substrate transporter [Aspergillus steynii IBT 23096]
MPMDLLRDSSLGQLVRFVTGKQCLLYPEERASFTYPEEIALSRRLGPGLEVSQAQSTLQARQGDEETGLAHGKDIMLVGWYDEMDAENPQNWSTWKRSVVTAVLWLYTFTVYCASAIYTPSVDGVMAEYAVDHTLSTLGLSLYVLGYGIGPLIFSPISEIPRVGRNAPYMITLFLYVLMAVPTVLTRHFAGFLVLRFLTGFLGSPCLATGGATLQDMYSPLKLPYGYTAWVGATFCAPALGPVISGFAVAASGDWRLSLWEILWMAVLTFVVMFVAFPETSAPRILLGRAQRIRKRLHDQRYIAQSEIDEANLAPRHVLINALIRPLQITVMDPAVFFTNLYSSYSYGVYYSFFEAFPLVYTDMYGFNLGLTGTAFLSIVVACLVGTLVYLTYVYWYLEPKIIEHGPGAQEQRLVPAIFASFLQPIGLFLFAWSSRQSIHWIVSMVGVALFSTGGFVLFQGIFMYLPLSYPRYAASLFAANDFFRSAWAAGAVLYARPLFDRLGIAGGVSLLGGLSCGGVLGVSALYMYGAGLRSRSKFAET